jgi:signal transduction histidine kinase
MTTETDKTNLIDNLAAHRTLSDIPRHELEWLAAHGELRRYEADTIVAVMGQPVDEMTVLLSGRTVVYVERGTGRRHVMESVTGDVTGILPFSRLSAPPGNVYIAEPSEAFAVHRDHFPELIRECPVLLTTLVHVMLDRARKFVSTDWQDDKMVSLGRLAAGLAHELNNPASAAARSAKLFGEAVSKATEASHALGAMRLTNEQREAVELLRNRSFIPPTTGVFSAIERADREDDIADWLAAHGADTAPAAPLAESGITRASLDEIASTLEGDVLETALHWIAAEYTARSLAVDVERATTRIYDLVSSVKRFTYMDRATVAAPTDIAEGLADAVAVLAGKARAKSVAVTLDVPADLPVVRGYAAELSQVWSNLLENALDASGPSGRVSVSAAQERDEVVVRVIDDGPGIPPEIQSRIFDPFFTTKGIGEGTGLGLDIARRIVRLHDGHIAVESRPGHTEFRIALPTTSHSPAESRPSIAPASYPGFG